VTCLLPSGAQEVRATTPDIASLCCRAGGRLRRECFSADGAFIPLDLTNLPHHSGPRDGEEALRSAVCEQRGGSLKDVTFAPLHRRQ